MPIPEDFLLVRIGRTALLLGDAFVKDFLDEWQATHKRVNR